MPKKKQTGNNNFNYLVSAMEDMFIFHDGEVDKSGQPYYLHPMRVSAQFLKNASSIDIFNVYCAVAGCLHDVIESFPSARITIEKDYPEEIYDAVDALTRREGETYRMYIKRLCRNDIARRVKVEDIKDNLRPERMFKDAPLERYYWALAAIRGKEFEEEHGTED